MLELFRKVFAATKVREVTDCLRELSDVRVLTWRAVGDNENNLATINLGSDPAAGLIERITNGSDAVLELEWIRRGQPSHLTSPRSAVEQWFDVPKGRLRNLNDIEEPKISALADRTQVTFRDSDREDRPTVDIRDTGIGIKVDDFATTILSLHKSRKLRKLFLAGAFGQGGSTALAYSPYTLIISRPSPLPDDPSSQAGEVGFTVVRFNSGDPNTDKHGIYEYLIDHSTGHPITVPAPEHEFPPGTLVRHFCMELGKYKSIITAPTGSLWFLTHNYLFDPVLPLRIIEARRNSGNGARRTVSGNFRLLTKGKYTEYQRNAMLTFRAGTVSLTWWVLSADGENARSRITQYVMVSKPIVVTYNSQKQGDFPNTIIKNDLRLPYLERYLVIHVDCDHLDNESRRQLFPTTREALRDTPIGDDLRRLIVDTLSGDEDLQRLDDERKRRYLRRSDTEAVENIRRRLSNRVRALLKVAGGGKGPRTLPPDQRGTTQSPVPIPAQEPPTFLDIVSADPRKVYAGRTFTIRFRTDADPAYFMSPDSFIAIIDAPSFGRYSGTTNVKQGYGVAYFSAAADLEPGMTAKITLELRPRRTQSLRAFVAVEVVSLPETADSGEGQVATPNINPQWVTAADPFWIDNDWDRSSAAKVVRGTDSVEIYVSAENDKLSSLIVKAQRRNVDAVDAIKDFYLEHIAFHAFLQDADVAQTDVEDENGGSKGGHNRELARACETVCGISQAIFELLVTSATEAG